LSLITSVLRNTQEYVAGNRRPLKHDFSEQAAIDNFANKPVGDGGRAPSFVDKSR